MATRYLFDTHALLHWDSRLDVSSEFLSFFDKVAATGVLFVSPVSFWECALLAKKGRIGIRDVAAWQAELIEKSGLKLLQPTVGEMIKSVELKDIHRDPFDRLLISQAVQNNLSLVTRDRKIEQYSVKTVWIK